MPPSVSLPVSTTHRVNSQSFPSILLPPQPGSSDRRWGISDPHRRPSGLGIGCEAAGGHRRPRYRRSTSPRHHSPGNPALSGTGAWPPPSPGPRVANGKKGVRGGCDPPGFVSWLCVVSFGHFRIPREKKIKRGHLIKRTLVLFCDMFTSLIRKSESHGWGFLRGFYRFPVEPSPPSGSLLRKMGEMRRE